MTDTLKNCLLCFVKYPRAGAVKTRLADVIGARQAAALYRCFVADVLRAVCETGVPHRICCFPADSLERWSAWLSEEYIFIPQAGGDLGERLRGCFEAAFSEGFTRVAAIGSDSPDLPPQFIAKAFSALADADAVLGPCHDGGYYLIGFSRQGYCPAVFGQIGWGTSMVYEQTRQRLQAEGRTCAVLSPWYDIDTLTDLEAFVLRNENGEHAVQTMGYIEREKPF